MRHPASIYLGEYGAIKQQIESLQNELEYLHTTATRATTRWEAVRPAKKGTGDSVAVLAVRHVDVEQRMKDMIENLKECLDMRLWLLDQMQDQTEKTVLMYRYINCMEWPDIMRKMHYEASMSYKIHRSALDHFWEIYQGKELTT